MAATAWAPLASGALETANQVAWEMEPVRKMPASLQEYGLICGDLCLVPKFVPFAPATVAGAFQWTAGGWQLATNWPVGSPWPRGVRGGFVVTENPDNISINYFVDPITKEAIWTVPWQVNLSSNTFAVTNSYLVSSEGQKVVVRYRDDSKLEIPVTGFGLAGQVVVDGDEAVVMVEPAFWEPDPRPFMVRLNLLTGAIIDTWYPSSARVSMVAFHRGKVLITTWDSTPVTLLYTSGSATPQTVEFPRSVMPGHRVLIPSISQASSSIRTPTGCWVASGGVSFLVDLSSDEVPISISRFAAGGPFLSDGYHLVYGGSPSTPAVMVDASPTGTPAVLLPKDPVEGSEFDGEIRIPIRLHRPSPTPVTVRIATLPGGTATPGADYQVLDQWVTFPAGETEVAVTLHLVSDTTPEAHETVRYGILSATGATMPPITETAGIIRASGVQRRMNPATADVIGPEVEQVTGGDGLVYRLPSYINQTGPPPRHFRIEVTDPGTGLLLESQQLIGYLPGRSLYSPRAILRATATGAACRVVHEGVPYDWEFSAHRDETGLSAKFAPPVDESMAGFVRLSAMEPAGGPIAASVATDVAKRPDGTAGADKNPSVFPLLNVSVPGDGTETEVAISTRQVHARLAPLSVAIRDGSGATVELAQIEPVPGRFSIPFSELPHDPAIPELRGAYGIVTIGDEIFTGHSRTVDASGRERGCVQVFHAETGAFRRTIWSPEAIKHKGFGYNLFAVGNDLLVLATESDRKVLNTMAVIEAATGRVKAILKSSLPEFGDCVVFDDNYVAISAPSDADPGRGTKQPGGLQLYRRSDYRQVGKLSFKGEGVGTSIALAGGSLFVGVPGYAWKPANAARGAKPTPFVGAVMKYASLPSLKKPEVIWSPHRSEVREQFGRELLKSEDGSLLVSASGKMFAVDPDGIEPTVELDMQSQQMPLKNFASGQGLRVGYDRKIYDEATGKVLSYLDTNYGPVAVAGGKLYMNSGSLLYQPLHRCGSYELWKRFAPPAADPSVPELERYVIDQMGELPQVTVDFSPYTYDFDRMIVGISKPLPPDIAMIVEYSAAGGPWKLAGIRYGSGPVRNRQGETGTDQNHSAPTPDYSLESLIEVRCRYDLITNIPFSLDEYRLHYPEQS